MKPVRTTEPLIGMEDGHLTIAQRGDGTGTRIIPFFRSLNAFLTGLLLFIFCHPAYTDNLELTDLSRTEQQWLFDHPQLTIGVQQDWKPLDYSEDGTSPDGVVHQLLKEAFSSLPVQLNFQVSPWSILYQHIHHDQVHILPAIRLTKERQKTLLFTDSYMKLYQYFFVHMDVQHDVPVDFSGMRLAIPRGYAITDIAKKLYPNLIIHPVATMDEAINAVMSREADLLLDIYSAVNSHLKDKGIHQILPYHPFDTLSLRMAVSEKHPELQAILGKALKRIPPTRLQQISRRWIVPDNMPGFVPLNRQESQWLRQHPDVSLGTQIDWLPLISVSGHHIKGIVGDYLSYIQQQLKIIFTHQFINPYGKEPQALVLDLNQQSLPSGYRLAADLGEYPIVVIALKSTLFTIGLENWSAANLVTTAGSSYNSQIIRHYPTVTLNQADTINESLNGVLSGTYDGALLPAAQANYMIQSSGFNQLSIAGVTDISVHAGLAIHTDFPILADTINRAHQRMPEMEKADIIQTWGKAFFPNPIDYNLIMQLFMVLALVILVSVYWNQKLATEVRRRKAIEITVRQERDNFLALFQQAVEGNLIYQDFQCVEANEAARRIFHCDNNRALKTTPLAELVDRYQPGGELAHDLILAAFTDCTTTGSGQMELCLTDGHNQLAWIDASLTRIHYLKKPSIYLVCRDVTAQKQLSDKLSAAHQAANDANQAKSDFIANVSHEIRTPLNSIVGFTDLLGQEVNDPTLSTHVSSIHTASNTLLYLINDVLDFSKLEADHMTLYESPTSIALLVAESGDFFRLQADKKHLSLHCEVDPALEQPVLLDAKRVNQILSNLMTNAIKFTDAGSVRIHAILAKHDRSTQKADINIQVIDTGIGISTSEQACIFEDFFQTKNASERQYQGTGLGLAISQRFAHLMGGLLELNSVPGVGSTFTLRLRGVPMCQANTASKQLTPTSLPSEAKNWQTVQIQHPASSNAESPAWPAQLTKAKQQLLQDQLQQSVIPTLNALNRSHNLKLASQLAMALTQSANVLDQPELAILAKELAVASQSFDIASIEHTMTLLTGIITRLDNDSNDQQGGQTDTE